LLRPETIVGKENLLEVVIEPTALRSDVARQIATAGNQSRQNTVLESSSPLHISTSPRGAVLPSGSLPPTVKAAASERTIVLRSGRQGQIPPWSAFEEPLRAAWWQRASRPRLGGRVANKTIRTVTSPLDRLRQ
jgi:hypothetical protein